MGYRIAVAEDKVVYRHAFLQKVQATRGLELVFMAENGSQLLDNLQRLPHPKLPQVVFVDIAMPEMDGIEAIKLGKVLFPQLHFVVLSVFDDDRKLFEAIKAGSCGYLLKHESALTLEGAVADILENGGAPMSPAIARKALTMLSQSVVPDSRPPTGDGIPGIITSREREILQLMVNGWDAKRIAFELDVSYHTVRAHIANIYEKLHVNSRAQVIAIAHRNRWL